jgi:ElaB/YqjD/DUF883 family membrane-anchored ribosome-binding protein
MTHDADRRPEKILAEIDRTREEMHRTLTAIEQRLNPQELLNQGLDYVRHSGATEFVQNLGGAARQNPLPVALTGIGIAWLMALGRQPAQRHGEFERSPAERVGEGASSVKRRANETLGSVRAAASSASATVAETSRRQWSRARGGFEYLSQEQPLLLGAIGLAVGAAVGASAPRTQPETRAFGEASRRLTEKAREKGGEQLARVRETVQRVADPA